MKYHYTYITVNETNNKVYLGIHSTDNLEDGYIGSGTLLAKDVKLQGRDKFKLLKIQFFKDRKSLLEAEKKLVNPKWVADEETYNKCVGGANPIIQGKKKWKYRK